MPCLDIKDYQVSCNNADNTASVQAWLDELANSPQGTWGKWSLGGTFNISGNLTFDVKNRAQDGIIIEGAGQHQTLLNFTTTTGTPFQMLASGGTSPANLVGAYYFTLRDMGFISNIPGVAFKIGQDNGGDAFQSCIFENLFFINNNTTHSTSAVTLRINGANANNYNNIVVGGNPATSLVAGYGDALQLTMATFCNFNGGSIGNANCGIRFTNIGNAALGFNYDINFDNVDVENTQYCLIGDSGPYSRIIARSGEWYTIFAGGYAVSSRAGFTNGASSCFIIDTVNMPNNPLYGGGGTAPALDPAHYTGVKFRGGAWGNITTPAIVASGATWTNTTGQVIALTIGTCTSIKVNGTTLPITSGTIILEPEDAFIPTYGAAPAWFMRNIG